MRFFLFLSALLLGGLPAVSETLEIRPETVTDWKPVYGEVETRTVIPARARIAGTVVSLAVTEGDRVAAGQVIATIDDEKLQLQIVALESQLDVLNAQLANAEAELERGQRLAQSGTISEQRLDSLQTAVDVLINQIAATGAERNVIRRQIEEGDVLAPDAGIVLHVPIAEGSVVGMGEAVAQIGSGGVFLRLSIPERFAGSLQEGDAIGIEGSGALADGVIAKLYPQIESGRLQADVEVEGLEDRYVGLRLPVRLSVGDREAILVPQAALSRGGGLDFVTVETAEGPVERVVVPGLTFDRDGTEWREILTGLQAGDRVVIGDE